MSTHSSLPSTDSLLRLSSSAAENGVEEQQALTSLLLRHRRPSVNESPHRLESYRIRTDTTAHVRHAVPVDDDDDADDDDEPGSCWWLWLQKRRNLLTKQSCKDYWRQIMPCQQCLNKDYSLVTFRKDAVAGVTVAIMAVPLSMSYARLAGLPAYYGLYATLIPPCIYPIFASSRHLGVGPAALVSLLVSTGVTPIVGEEGLEINTPEYVSRYTQLAIQCSFLAGLINIGMGLLRLGFITQFLSRALISGFTSGAAIIIAFSQVKYLFGYNIKSSSRLQDLIEGLVDGISQFNWKTFLMGSLSILILVLFKNVSQKYPKFKWIRPVGPFLVSAVAIILTFTLDLDQRGIPVVGSIPKGLPTFTVNQWTPLSMKLWVSTDSECIAVPVSSRLTVSPHQLDLLL